MGMIGYDVLNVGEKELAGGITEFQRLAEKSKLVLTNANFIYRDSGEQLFAPFAIREYKLPSGRSMRIGFIGLNALNSAFARESSDKRVVIMRDPVEAARLYLPLLRPRVDLVVLLANLSLRDLMNVLTGVSGVDLALVSYGPRLSIEGKLESIADVPVLYSGDQGKRMGEVRLTLREKGEPPALMAGHVLLTRRYPAEPKLQSLIDRTIARVNEINRQSAERLAAAGQAIPGTAPAPPVTPGPQPRRGGAGSIASPVAAAGSKPFLTATTCAACHGEEHEIFLQSAHAHAFDTLVKANQDFNPECVKCHVTGFDQPQGFANARQTPDLANVQCEACHGNGADHVLDPQKPFGQVPPRSCFTCHNKENSPDFVFFKYWDMIKH